MNRLVTYSATALLALTCVSARAQLPADFPTLTVTTNFPAAVAPGYVFQGVNLAPPGIGYYAMIVTNDGTPVWYQEMTNACYDFKVLPNGDVLLVGYYLTPVDMSQVVTNGNPAALVSGAVLQELDAQRNVVWQWRAWDHYPFTQQWVNSTEAIISEFHIYCLLLDIDGNLVVSTPDWVKKINRQTGDIMWHLGGVENQFTFVGVTQQQGVSDFAS